MTVRDFIEMDIDIDVVDDVCEELYIAAVCPIVLTELGKATFKEILDLQVTVTDDVAILHIDDPEDRVWVRRLKKAREFFEAAAGYVSCEQHDAWFAE